MSRTMYDSVNAYHIPADAVMVAGYIEGPYAWSSGEWARFPHAVKVQIATVAMPARGMVLDVEAGDAAPDLAPGWCARRRAAGVDPSVYCNASTWPVVRAAFAAHQEPEPHWWIADYDGIATLPAGAVAKQYANDKAAGYDLSIVADYWPGIDPAPHPTGDAEVMHLFTIPMPVGTWCLCPDGGRYFHVAHPPDVAALEAAGATPAQPLTLDQHNLLVATFPNPAASAAAATATQETPA